MATHTHSDNNAASETDASSSGDLRWVYDEESQAILHEDGCEECDDWKEHYKFSQDTGHPSMLEARRAHHIAIQHSFKSRVQSLEQEHNEMLQEVTALQQELEQLQMEIQEVQKNQVRIINSNLERKH